MGNARVRPLHKQIESVVAKAPLQIILIDPPLQSKFATEWSCLAVTPIASLWRNDATEAFVVTGNDTLDLSELEDILGRLNRATV